MPAQPHLGTAGRARTVLLLGATLVACVGLPGPPPEGEGSTSSTGGTSPSGETVVVTSTMDPTATSNDPEGSSSTTSQPPSPFVFDETPYEDYVRVDRAGFPAVNTFLNLLGDKDAYNQGSPADDAALTFASNVFDSLEILHIGAPGNQVPDNTGLDDDLAAVGLEPCIPPPYPMATCDDQANPFAIPDVLILDLDDPVGFPNGRRFVDPVIDVIFALLLLDLDSHDVSTLYDLDQDGTPGPSLDPIENDVAFPARFPYLAPPHG